MKKLCYIIPEYDPLVSGHYYHIYELLEKVAEKLDICFVVEKAAGRPQLRGVKRILTLKCRFLPLRVLERLVVYTYLRFLGYGTFYVHYSQSSALVASLVTRLTGGKTLYWNCGVMKAFMPRWQFNWEVVKRKVLDDFSLMLVFRAINSLVTCTEFMRKYFSDNFGVPEKKIKLMPNWVNLERFSTSSYDRNKVRKEFKIKESARVVLFVHRLAPRTGAHYLSELASIVASHIPDVVLIIVGEGPYKETLQREITEKCLQSLVRVVGGVPNRDVPKYYALADVFIMPSDEEAFGRVLLEAMAMGVPIVATYHGSMDYILTEKQRRFTVAKGDINALALKTGELLTDESLRQELRSEGLKQVRQFSIDNVAVIFQDVVSQR